MQESPLPRPPLRLRRSHLDSATYRAVLRILSHCVEVESQTSPPPLPLPLPLPSLSRLHPGPVSVTVSSEEKERAASCEGVTVSCGTPRDVSNGSNETRGNGERDGHSDFPENEGQELHSVEELGVVEIPDVLLNECPRLAEAHVEDSLPEGLGDSQVRDGISDGSRDVAWQKEQPRGSPALPDSFVDFSRLMEELGLRGEDEETGELDPDGFKRTASLVDSESLICSQDCPLLDARGHGENSPGRTGVSPGNESPGDELPTQLVSKDPGMPSVPTENAPPTEESCTEAQLKICDASRPSMDGSGLTETEEHQKSISLSSVEEDEMEEGEIPNEGEILDLPSDLEPQHVATGATQVEQRDLTDDFAQERNITHMGGAFIFKGASGGVDFINQKMDSAVHESDKLHIAKVGLKPQKKKKKDKETKKDVGKSRKKVDLPNKRPNVEVEHEHKKPTNNSALSADAVSENISSGNLSLDEVSIQEITFPSQEKPSKMEDVKVLQKRKRAPLTGSRKEKKKLAKKRKRAETNRKLGVKRLKLEILPKPKKVIPCSFYQKGRCQKGDSCKFSHDIIPDTKSMPCTFFARGTCLKGNDCPFDHQLSKYPCHNYMSQGRCNRGDDCLFSHKIPIGKLSSAALITSETDSVALSGKQSLQKCLNSSNLPSAVIPSPKETSPRTNSPMLKPSLEQMNVKQPVKMPKGLSFLSFGKERSIGSVKQRHDLALKKGGGTQFQKQEEKVMLIKPQNLNEILVTPPEKSLSCRTLTSLVNEDMSLSLLQKPPLLVQHNVEIKSCESVQSLGSVTPFSNGPKNIINEENRLTDASRILEEFLFSGLI